MNIPSGFWGFSAQVVIPQLLVALKWTLLLTVTAAAIGTVVGLLAALARISRNRLLNSVVTLYITLFRGTPLMLQLLFFYFGLPMIYTKFNAIDSFTASMLAMGLNSGAYIAEIIRAAIQSIDRGQMEAARSLGLSYGQAMRKVILPQTFRRLIPPMVNELIALSKDTAQAMVISLAEVMRTGSSLVSKYARLDPYIWMAVVYLSITLLLTYVSQYYERRLEARE